jgi:predicted AAA+ superfamily ATPase
MQPRHLLPRIREALGDRPVVVLVGPRQVGKSTLALGLIESGELSRYLSLDDVVTLAAARADPAGFVAGLPQGSVIDEVHRAPELYLAIKARVDRDRRPGSFLITGSADVLVLPGIADALVGRAEIVTLLPFSAGELSGQHEDFVAWAFSSEFAAQPSAVSESEIASRIVRGGFPEPSLAGDRSRRRWFGSYVTTIVQREIRDLAGIAGLADLPRLFTMLAARSASLLNTAELSRTSGLPQTTLRRYLTLIEGAFVATTLPAWTGDPGRRLARAPKLHMTDSGLAAWLTGADEQRLLTDRERLGALLESFVAMEIRKQLGWSSIDARMTHYRSHSGLEVDLVLEDRAGNMLGIEVKAAATVRADDVRGLRRLSEQVPKRWHRGVVLYLGSEAVPFGERLDALPISALWKTSTR